MRNALEEIMNRLGLVLVCIYLVCVSFASSTRREFASLTEAPEMAETRCGWFHNPTPANAWLTDAAGEWTIAVQGGYQAEGDWPDFSDARWVKTNINYGYGCACMKVTTNRAEKRVLTILSSYSRP